MPVLESSESWAYKNASLYAQMLMIAATANGLGMYVCIRVLLLHVHAYINICVHL